MYTFGGTYTRWRAIFPGTCVLILKIEGKCLYLRAKFAHFVGHLPREKQMVFLVKRLIRVRNVICLRSIFGAVPR